MCIENISDQWSIESSSIYAGYFHILGGTITFRPKKRRFINWLISTKSKIWKNWWSYHSHCATVEGQTTAYYIQDSLKNSKVKITKLAQGLPIGGEIESLDDGTLYSAFKNRSKLETNSD